MNQLADRFEERGIRSIFLYTHEAHPGEHYPHLTSMDQKFQHAAALREVYGVTRPILVDALDGVCHQAYGSMPNMTWIFNRAGIPVYKSNWTHASSLENALEYYLKVRDRRKGGERVAPFQVQRLDYRENNRKGFYEGLARNGHRAVKEFKDAFS